ncbi:MAG: hypothetical protein LBQ54_12760 [Planctomycetaceae bacterium]|jgi:hypothetical protein|nr:hypothetical protein [Planctomycetaceae bacterium]
MIPTAGKGVKREQTRSGLNFSRSSGIGKDAVFPEELREISMESGVMAEREF